MTQDQVMQNGLEKDGDGDGKGLPGEKQTNRESRQQMMDTDKAPNGENATSGSIQKNPGSNTKKVNPNPQCKETHMGPLQLQLDDSLNDVRADIFSWMDTTEEDKDRCFDLLQQLELVYEVDQNQSYESDFSVQPTEYSHPEGAHNTKRDSGGPILNLANEAKKQKKWGPVEAPRHSDRIDTKGRTMLEIAEELKRKKDLGIPGKYHSRLQDLVASFKNNQEMASALQGPHAGDDRLVLPPPPKTATRPNDDQDAVDAFKEIRSTLKLRSGHVAAGQSPVSVLEVLGSPRAPPA